MGDAESNPIRLSFNPQLRVEFRGATVTSDAGLLLPRELDERLGISALIECHFGDPRTWRNCRFPLADLFRQSIYSRLILVHEVIVSGWIDRILPSPRALADEGLRQHLLSAHTTVNQVGKVADSAGGSTLVLSHIVPGNDRAEDLIPAQRDFSGQLVVGEDLLRLGVTRKRRRTP